MKVDHLKKDPDRIKQSLSVKNDIMVSTADIKIMIPKHYTKQKMASITTDVYIVGVFAYVLEDKYYGTSIAPTMMRITPDTTQTVKVDGVEYFLFGFSKGSVICPNINLIKRTAILYNLWNEFISNGRIPWYFDYENLAKLFSLSGYYTGSALGANNVVHEMIIAVLTKNADNTKESYRYALKSKKDLDNVRPLVVKTLDVSKGASNTTAKIIGGYFDEGINSALINPSKRKEPIEDLLRR